MKKKVLIFSVVALFVILFSVEKSAALFIDLGESTIGQVTEVPLILDADGNFIPVPVTWVTGTIRNDGDEPVTFMMEEMSYWSGNLASMISMDFFAPRVLLPGETFSAPLITVVAGFLDFYLGGYTPAPVGTVSGMREISFGYMINGAMDYTHWVAPPGEFIWEATVVSAGSDPVPEPATILLFGAGLAGLAGFSRRKKKA